MEDTTLGDISLSDSVLEGEHDLDINLATGFSDSPLSYALDFSLF